MKKHIYDEKNGLSYTLYGDYYLPDLVINEEEPTYGQIWMGTDGGGIHILNPQTGKISVFTDDREADRASECSRTGSQRTGGGIDETDVKTVGGHRGIEE